MKTIVQVRDILRGFMVTPIRDWVWGILFSVYIGIGLNLPLFIRKGVGEEEFASMLVIADIVFSTLACWALFSLFSLFGQRVLKGVSVFLLTASAVAAYYIWFFDVVIGYGIIQATIGTEFALAAESVGYQLVLFVLVFAGFPIMFLVRKPIVSSHFWKTRYLLRAVYALIAIIGLSGVDKYYSTFRVPMADGRIPANPFGVAAHSYLPSNLVAASGMALSNFVINLQLQNNLRNPNEVYSFTESVPLDDLYLVFVIGESARFDRMSLMGAARKTTPLLDEETTVIGYKGRACNTVTKLSLDCMFVREGGVEERGVPIQQFVHEQNLFNTLKELGFSVDLFAMQAETRFYNKVSADRYKIREEICAEAGKEKHAAIDDYLLVDQLEQSITGHPKGQHAIILHTKGSHFNYTNRYPRQFAAFAPECAGIDGNCSDAQLYNSYDNSILYTDYLLASLIERLRDKKALLIYASDHGESIEDGLHFHGTPKHLAPAEQFDIPIILWASDKYLEVSALAKLYSNARLKQEADTVVRHEQIFESVLGCLGYQAENGGIRAKNNWCSPLEEWDGVGGIAPYDYHQRAVNPAKPAGGKGYGTVPVNKPAGP